MNVHFKKGKAKVVILLMILVCSTMSCRKYPDPTLCWDIEFSVNNEKYYFTWEESRFDIQRGEAIGYLPIIEGKRIYDEEHVLVGLDYSNLCFRLPVISCISDSWFFDMFYFEIKGDSERPFMDMVDYSNPDNIAVFHPYLRHTYDKYRGRVQSKLLSSSFRFSHSYDKTYGRMLDFYFDFEEVITAVPSEYDEWPRVGDTVRIQNGHFRQGFMYLNKNDDNDELLRLERIAFGE